jgi:hypothetical protein
LARARWSGCAYRATAALVSDKTLPSTSRRKFDRRKWFDRIKNAMDRR